MSKIRYKTLDGEALCSFVLPVISPFAKFMFVGKKRAKSQPVWHRGGWSVGAEEPTLLPLNNSSWGLEDISPVIIKAKIKDIL